MPLTDEQVKGIKDQLLKQLDKFPEEKRKEIQQQIEGMSNEEVENFVKQNQLGHLPGGCVFCALIEGKMPSFKIGENEENIALLEINPLSKGHTLIIPKKHEGPISKSSNELAKGVKEKLETKYSPNEVQIKETEIMGHPLIEVIPIYGNETERSKVSEEVLKKIQKELTKIKKIRSKIEELPEEEIKEELPKFKARIP
jgi:diadenosine tetraphosphate (Ap4A) HIT family hydrolase